MHNTINSAPWQYEVFISYARFDDALHGLVAKLAERLSIAFREITGMNLRVFVDTRDIANAMLWEARIESAINNSALLLMIETPSYYTSEWCQRELDHFLAADATRRRHYDFLPYESLIFPVRRASLAATLDLSPDAKHRMREIASRRSLDRNGLDLDSPKGIAEIQRLATDMASVLQKLMQPALLTGEVSSKLLKADNPLTITMPLVTASAGTDGQQLMHLLRDAQSAVLISISHENLAEQLELALAEKRRLSGIESTFWDALEIVFPSEGVLDQICDDLSFQFPDPVLALQERRRRVAHSRRRLMSLLVRIGAQGRWRISSYPHLLPFTGNLFITSDAKRLVQLQVRRSSVGESEQLHVDFIDRVDDIFESAFREVVALSVEDHEIVLAGAPDVSRDSFIVKGSRYRRSVLIEDQNTSDWIPALLCITWRQSEKGPQPLLQVNTPKNSTREMSKASHISGYLNKRDLPAEQLLAAEAGSNFRLPAVSIDNALRRELLDDFSIVAQSPASRSLGTQRFYYADKENLFFYIMEYQITQEQVFTEEARMFPWTIQELLNIRRFHVLDNTEKALSGEFTRQQRARAREIIHENLIAHSVNNIADEVDSALSATATSTDLANRINRLKTEVQVYKYSAGRELAIEGLAGLQYRIFFSHILNCYSSIGIADASEEQARIKEDSRRSQAIARLAELYDDEGFMTSLPMEL